MQSGPVSARCDPKSLQQDFTADLLLILQVLCAPSSVISVLNILSLLVIIKWLSASTVARSPACKGCVVPVYTENLRSAWSQPRDTKRESYGCNLVKPSDGPMGSAASERLRDAGGPDADMGSHPDCFARCTAFVRWLSVVFRFPDPHPPGGSLPNAKSPGRKVGSRSTHGLVHFPLPRQEALLLWL